MGRFSGYCIEGRCRCVDVWLYSEYKNWSGKDIRGNGTHWRTLRLGEKYLAARGAAAARNEGLPRDRWRGEGQALGGGGLGGWCSFPYLFL